MFFFQRSICFFKREINVNTLYPIFLKVSGRKCVVAGGGRVAEKKVEKLLESGAEVLVISPGLTSRLEEYVRAKSIQVLRRRFIRGDLKGAFLVIGATNSEQTNRTIADEARKTGVLCNIVDRPQLCDFYVPSVHQSGDLKIAVSTHGKSPALARKIKEELSWLYGPKIADILESIGNFRKTLEKTVSSSRERGAILWKLIQKYTFASSGAGSEEGMRKLKEEIEKWNS
jgi:precorrin-2 dehydrogenase/sirohydrochlorin ferrochelatase